MKLLFFLLLVLLVFVSAAPAAKSTKRRTVHAKQRRWRADELKEHHRLMRKTHKNYVPYYPDAPITTIMTVGTPVVEYSIALETGTDALFLLSKDYAGRVANQSFYDSAQSSTSKNAGNYTGFSGDFEVSGSAFTDVVGLFGFDSNVTQRFGAVTDVDDPYEVNPAIPDGVFGMSWDPNDAANPNENSSAVVNLFAEIGGPRYWVEWIADVSMPDKREYDVQVAFGYELDNLCQPMTLDDSFPLTWLEDSRSLAFTVDSFTYKELNLAGGYAKVDTGVPNILLPYGTFASLYDEVQPTWDFDYGVYTVPCSQAEKLPAWGFTIGGKEFAVPSAAYVADLGLPGDQCVWSAFYSDDDTTPVVLGYPFHEAWCIKMDVDNQTIGFSRATLT